MKQSRATIRKGVRELEREIERMKREEQTMIADIRRTAAAQGNTRLIRTMTKELIRQRNAINKCFEMKCQLQGVRNRIQHMNSVATMSEAMRGATQAMRRMNRQVNLPAMQRIMHEFERQGEMMEMKQELMDDAIDDVMHEDGDEEAQEELISRVMDEIGIDLSHQLAGVPDVVAAAPNSELGNRIDKLKK